MRTLMTQMATHLSFMSDWWKFRSETNQLELVQTKILGRILKNHPYLKSHDEFLNEAVHDYSSMTKKLEGKDLKVIRYQPTSGSGDKEKLIPYTGAFIRELNQALNPWLFDLSRQFPAILKGRHYWSISWLPTHWRQNGWHLDDFELLPSWKKNLIRLIMAVPNEVSHAESLKATQFSTLAYLIEARDLTFFSVWSPTFLLQLLALMEEWKEPLYQTLMTGKWVMFEDELKHLSSPHSQVQAGHFKEGRNEKLWPHLKLLSSWDSSTSEKWAEKLKSQLPHASFQGKGLWATECVVTIPFEGKMVLSYQSHYYEFIDLKSEKLLPSHQLQVGMEVHPVITSGNGFTRYRLQDRLLVTGHYHSVPTFEFIERDSTFDMVGEKLDAVSFRHLHDEIKNEFPELTWVAAFAINSPPDRPHYSFVLQGQGAAEKIQAFIQKILNEHFHYHLARELGQLGIERIHLLSDGLSCYERFQLNRGMVQGNIKVELATMIRNQKESEIFHDCFTE